MSKYWNAILEGSFSAVSKSIFARNRFLRFKNPTKTYFQKVNTKLAFFSPEEVIEEIENAKHWDFFHFDTAENEL